MIYAIIFLGVVVLDIIIALLSNKLLYSYFDKADSVLANCGFTSLELLAYFITHLNLNVKITEYSTGLNNSYNIKQKIIVLSKDVINNKSVGALTISMHEFGHALQHKNKSKLFYFYLALSVLNKITSILLLPLVIFLIVSLFLPLFYLEIAVIIVIIFYIINLLARIFIIPLEKNASDIAMKLLTEYEIFDKKELKIAKKLLKLAYSTYIGGFFINYIKIFRKIIKNF